MADPMFELIEMENGDIVLKSVDDQSSEPVVTLTFSKTSLLMMKETKMLVAQAMVEAGIAAYAELTEPDPQEDVMPAKSETLH